MRGCMQGGYKLLPSGPDTHVLFLKLGPVDIWRHILEVRLWGPRSSMMSLKHCIFIQRPPRSELYQLQRQLLSCCNRWQLEVTVIARTSASPGSIFILGSHSWGSARIVFLQKGCVASSRLWSPGLYYHIALGAGKDI